MRGEETLGGRGAAGAPGLAEREGARAVALGGEGAVGEALGMLAERREGGVRPARSQGAPGAA